MPLLHPRTTLEPPPEYVAFVGRHLATLRADATRVVGDRTDADRLYPDVLTEVAVHWRWLELSRTRLGRSTAADRYLHHAFLKLAQRWQHEQLSPTELPPDIVVRVEMWYPDAPPPPVDYQPAPHPGTPPVRSSAATRLAPHLRPAGEHEFGPIAEAAVAWWHAREAHRRRRYLVLLGILLLITAVIARLSQAATG
jgi:hypothetical protein